VKKGVKHKDDLIIAEQMTVVGEKVEKLPVADKEVAVMKCMRRMRRNACPLLSLLLGCFPRFQEAGKEKVAE
jgi:hypothetical protein